ncbi:MAG: cysteine peptidase family C39 domain-containing protein [Candidatus Latescibacteria bacterium]|nr:cysteine peptidase family C39 domain-containing protein [Candidatus Latescibacterota bacterium]
MTGVTGIAVAGLFAAGVCVALVEVDRRHGGDLDGLSPQRVVAALAPGRYLGRGPYVYQRREGECGPVCLANLVLLTGRRDIDINALLHAFGDVQPGVSVRDLRAVGARFGLVTEFMRHATFDDLETNLPGVLLVEPEHFVVVKECVGASFVVVDPALGMFEMTRAELSAIWGGVFIHVDVGSRVQ